MKEMKQDRKTRYTLKALNDSLIELMQKKPFLKITVTEICEQADINRSTFYFYYRDQYALLKQIEDETFTSIEEVFKKYEHKQNREAAMNMLRELLQYIVSNSNSIQVLLSENGDIDFQKKLFRHFIQWESKFKKYSEKITDKKRKEYHSVFVVNGATSVMQLWLKNGMDVPVEEFAELLHKMTS